MNTEFLTASESGLKKALAIYSAAAAGVFFIIMLVYTRMQMSAPLDDAFIYFQYAKNMALGHFFEYVIGDGYSSGATSFLYAFLLVPFSMVLKGEAMIVVTYFFGAACLFLTGWYMYRIVKQLTGSELYSWFGAAFFVTNGNFLWGYFSGMEICLFGTLISASLYYLMQERDLRGQLISLCLLSIVRPEGFFLTAALAGIKALSKLVSGKAGRKDGFLVYLLPMIPGIIYFCINRAMTGDFMPNTMRAKSDFSQYIFYWPEAIKNGLDKYMGFLVNIFNGGREHWFLHYSFFLFLIGTAPGMWAEVRNRRAGIFTTAFVWFFVGTLSTVFSSFFTVHNYRYPMPFSVIFTVFVVYGLYSLMSRLKIGNRDASRAVNAAALSVFLVFNVFTVFANMVNFGRDCRDILSQSISAGKWIKKNLPAGSRVAINDVGAITYFSDAKIYDLVGLVTNHQARFFRNGIAGTYEELEHARPDYFMVHLGWFNYERFSFFGRADKRLTDFNISKEPAYFVVGSPEVCVQFKKDLVNSGDTMKKDHTGRGRFAVADRLDVQDLRSEEAHSYSIRAARVPDVPASLLEEDLSYGKPVIDGGRTTSGGEQFKISGLQPGMDLKLVRRSYNQGHYRINVYADGKPAGAWESPAGSGFLEEEFTIKGGLVNSPELEIKLESADGGAYNAFYYWALQPKKAAQGGNL